MRRTSIYGKIFPTRRDRNEKTAFGYVHDYYCASYCVCRRMHWGCYEYHKSFICNINCYKNFKNKCNDDTELSNKSESDDSAKCKSI